MRTFLIQTITKSVIIPFTESTIVCCSYNKNNYSLFIISKNYHHLFKFELDKTNELAYIENFQKKMIELNAYLSDEQNSQSHFVMDLTDFDLQSYDIEAK